MNVTIKELINVMKGELILGDPKTVVKRSVVDSRNVKAKDLFFALKGERADGHDFAVTACAQGAGGVVVSHLKWMERNKNLSAAVIRVEDPLLALQSLAHFLREK